CQVTDDAHNVGATTFTVTVTSIEPPLITGTGLIAEAQGPGGAVVNYQIGATGFTTDCAPAGSNDVQSCVAWSPAYRGLGFTPINNALALNTNPGDDEGSLYLLYTDPSAFQDFHDLL